MICQINRNVLDVNEHEICPLLIGMGAEPQAVKFSHVRTVQYIGTSRYSDRALYLAD